ncbi:MAG: hypothetical protein HY426_00370 [Candidatus Levybacteria bacterium]|nr:hypothetical protein [Candidatus Levybacteria bacterium]
MGERLRNTAIITVGAVFAARAYKEIRARYAEKARREAEGRERFSRQIYLEWEGRAAEGKAFFEQQGLFRDIPIIDLRLGTTTRWKKGNRVEVPALVFSWQQEGNTDPSLVWYSRIDLDRISFNLDEGALIPTICLEFNDFDVQDNTSLTRDYVNHGEFNMAAGQASQATVRLNQETHSRLFPQAANAS